MAKQIGKAPGALWIIWRTRPFLPGRLAVYSVFFFATTGFLAFLYFLFTQLRSAWFQALALVVALFGYWLVQRSIKRYMGRTGDHPHLSAMATVLKGGNLAKGKAQLEEASARVAARLPESNEEHALEGLAHRVLKESSGVVVKIGDLKPFPGFDRLKYINGWLISGALQIIRSALFGFTLYRSEVGAWQAVRQGLNLYAQLGNNYMRTVLRTYLWGLAFALVAAVLILVFPGLDLLSATKDQILPKILLLLGIAMAAWVVKRALYEPFADARALSVFVKRVEGLTPSDEWDVKLWNSSKRFRDIVDRAGVPVRPVEATVGEGERPEASDEEKKRDRDRGGSSTSGSGSSEPTKPSNEGKENSEADNDSAHAATVRMPALSEGAESASKELDSLDADLDELDRLYGSSAAGTGDAGSSPVVDELPPDETDPNS